MRFWLSAVRTFAISLAAFARDRGRRKLLIGGALLVALTGVLFPLKPTTLGAANEVSPPLKLPWKDGQAWRTGVAGFHGANDALDFFPPDTPLGLEVFCEGGPGWLPAESKYWVVAAAAGTVIKASDSTVLIDHGNGWVTGYYHVHSFQVQLGDTVPPKWQLGHPSTYGGCGTGPQVHFWALGPGGKTLRDVKISGRDATGIGINELISKTGNLPPATTTPKPSPIPTATPKATAKGDVDCDGDVDAVDALKTLRQVAALTAGQEEQCSDVGGSGASALADIDCDGDIDAADSLLILRHVAGLPVTLPPACAAPGT